MVNITFPKTEEKEIRDQISWELLAEKSPEFAEMLKAYKEL